MCLVIGVKIPIKFKIQTLKRIKGLVIQGPISDLIVERWLLIMMTRNC